MAGNSSSSITRSVDSLQKIYAIVIGLAITKIAMSLPQFGDNFFAEVKNQLPNIISFLLIVVPFFHGMNRHLDSCYIERDKKQVVQGALLLDFFVFFIESILLFICAKNINQGLTTIKILGSTLIVDMVWAVASHLIHYRSFTSTVLKWLIINAITLALGLLVILLNCYSDYSKSIVITTILTIRTILDYILCWKFYFPDK